MCPEFVSLRRKQASLCCSSNRSGFQLLSVIEIKRDWEIQGSRKINGNNRNNIGGAGEQRRSSEQCRRRWKAGVRDHGGCGAYHELRLDGNQGWSLSRHLRLQLREALRRSVESGLAHHSGSRCHRLGPVRYRQNLHVCSHHLLDGRHFQPRGPSIDLIAHKGTCISDRESDSGHWGFHIHTSTRMIPFGFCMATLWPHTPTSSSLFCFHKWFLTLSVFK